MAAVYTVSTGRNQKMTFAGQQDSIEITWHQDYFVEVSNLTAVQIAAVSPYDVLTASGIPVVNRSIYTNDGKIIPYVICRGKTAEQDPQRLARWKVSTQWKATRKTNSEETDNQPIAAPAALTAITPRVVAKLGETQAVLYEDKQATPKRYLTPTGNFYAEPAIERIATLTLQITQYEPTPLLYADLRNRKFKVNQNVYRGEPRYDWLIEDVEFTEVDVTLSGGVTTAALVTYTVSHSPHLYGWKDDRALIDTQYLSGSDKLDFQEGQLRSQGIGLITVTGTKKTDQTEAPDHEQFEPFETIDFDSFLQA